MKLITIFTILINLAPYTSYADNNKAMALLESEFPLQEILKGFVEEDRSACSASARSLSNGYELTLKFDNREDFKFAITDYTPGVDAEVRQDGVVIITRQEQLSDGLARNELMKIVSASGLIKYVEIFQRDSRWGQTGYVTCSFNEMIRLNR